jgi:hypothetical protein
MTILHVVIIMFKLVIESEETEDRVPSFETNKLQGPS